jgi:hypothetical protein
LSIEKIFIIGLPRTSTTSVCAAMLDLGYRVAHTCYTQKTLDEATVIADTPVFCDFTLLAQEYPNAKFIYLTRDLTLWLPSIQQLLQRMYKNITRADGGFNPILKRCYQKIFSPYTIENITNEDFLIQCYLEHQRQVYAFFNDSPNDLLTLDVSEVGSYQQLLNFLALSVTEHLENADFPLLNQGKKVTGWKQISHPLKIESTKNGKIDGAFFYNRGT